MKTKKNISPTQCKKCNDDRYILVGCCSGFECGCMGRATDIKPCESCNENEQAPASDDLKQAYPFFFGSPDEQSNNIHGNNK